jgi:hypothetical protein
MNFNDIGSNIGSDSSAFKKIQYFSKTNPQALFNNTSEYNLRYEKLANLYFNDAEALKSSSYGTTRQHNYSSIKSLNNTFLSKMETKNIDKFLDYNTTYNRKNNPQNSANFNDYSTQNTYGRTSELNSYDRLGEISINLNSPKTAMFDQFLKTPNKTTLLGSESDGKQLSNPLKYLLGGKFTKKTFLGKS